VDKASLALHLGQWVGFGWEGGIRRASGVSEMQKNAATTGAAVTDGRLVVQ